MNEKRHPQGRENGPRRENSPRRADRFAERPQAEEVEGQLEGRNAITEALKSGRTIDKVFVAAGDTARGLPDLDERHTADSVFCKAGSGYAVPWQEAKDMMHLPTGYGGEENEASETVAAFIPKKKAEITEKEWVEIFERTYGKIKPRTVAEKKVNAAPAEQKKKPRKAEPPKEEYLVLDGYNVIFAMPALRKLAEADIGDAREALIRTVCNLAAMKKCRALIVFDAYRRKEGQGSEEEIGPVTVVYTKEKQTADAFIEKTTYRMAADYRVRVVSSDKEEQFVILGHGALRVSVREFEKELASAAASLEDFLERK